RYARLIQVRNPMPDDVSSQPSSRTPAAKQNTPKHAEKQVTQPHILTPVAAVQTKAAQSAPKAMPVVADQSITGVLDALEAWREAWSSQDLDAYFSTYTDDYQPDARFNSYDAWKAYKKRVISNKSFIRIEFEQVEVNMQGRDTATVKLLQRFHSNTYNGKDFKKITFKYTPQGWRILAEASVQ
ncbi:MAG: nuclear transport factor 2 family protein, partial [Ghiorsea sp.]|nr:nuclear transport factor 2 family protein [Ghiorsea sp.]